MDCVSELGRVRNCNYLSMEKEMDLYVGDILVRKRFLQSRVKPGKKGKVGIRES